jgi:hypothetical protein
MPAQGPVGWLQGVMLGERHSTYRRFVLALAVVAVGLAAAYGLTAVGLVAVDAA